MSAAIFNAFLHISSEEMSFSYIALAAAKAKFPPEPTAAIFPSGSNTSPEPDIINKSLPSVTTSMASKFLKYLSVRQSFASSIAPLDKLPGKVSNFLSNLSNKENASAVEPAKPTTISSPPGFNF